MTTLTCVVSRVGLLYVALCPQLDIVSQGSSHLEAERNLREEVELFLGIASRSETERDRNQSSVTPASVTLISEDRKYFVIPAGDPLASVRAPDPQ